MLFLGWSLYTIASEGFFAFWGEHTRNAWGNQIWFDLLIAVFKHADGRRAVLLNNYHFAFTQWPTVEFDVDAGKVMELDKWSAKEAPVVDDSPDMDGLQISLDSGDGRLFLLPGQ